MQNMQAMSAMRPAGRQKGFTIIELVVVILLLGILAATALPRFMDVTDEAHEAAVDALEGGLTTSAALFRAQWYGKGQPSGAVPEFGNGVLIANTAGWPASTAAAPNGDSDTCVAIYNELLQAGRPGITSVEAALGDASPIAGQVNNGLQVSFGVTPTILQGAASGVDVIAAMGTGGATVYCVDGGGGTCDGSGFYADSADADAPAPGAVDYNDEDEALDASLNNVCSYYYVGQYKTPQAGLDGSASAAGSPVNGLETLTFNLGTGAITRSITAFEP